MAFVYSFTIEPKNATLIGSHEPRKLNVFHMKLQVINSAKHDLWELDGRRIDVTNFFSTLFHFYFTT